MSPDIGDRRRQYCHWHYVALTHPSFATEFQEFERWAVRWRAYCSVENHYPPAMVWDAILGVAPLHGEPSECGNPSCMWRGYRKSVRRGGGEQARLREVAV